MLSTSVWFGNCNVVWNTKKDMANKKEWKAQTKAKNEEVLYLRWNELHFSTYFEMLLTLSKIRCFLCQHWFSCEIYLVIINLCLVMIMIINIGIEQIRFFTLSAKFFKKKKHVLKYQRHFLMTFYNKISHLDRLICFIGKL